MTARLKTLDRDDAYFNSSLPSPKTIENRLSLLGVGLICN